MQAVPAELARLTAICYTYEDTVCMMIMADNSLQQSAEAGVLGRRAGFI